MSAYIYEEFLLYVLIEQIVVTTNKNKYRNFLHLWKK